MYTHRKANLYTPPTKQTERAVPAPTHPLHTARVASPLKGPRAVAYAQRSFSPWLGAGGAGGLGGGEVVSASAAAHEEQEGARARARANGHEDDDHYHTRRGRGRGRRGRELGRRRRRAGARTPVQGIIASRDESRGARPCATDQQLVGIGQGGCALCRVERRACAICGAKCGSGDTRVYMQRRRRKRLRKRRASRVVRGRLKAGGSNGKCRGAHPEHVEHGPHPLIFHIYTLLHSSYRRSTAQSSWRLDLD